MNCGSICVPKEFVRNSDGTYSYKGYTIVKVHSRLYKAMKDDKIKFRGERLLALLHYIDDKES